MDVYKVKIYPTAKQDLREIIDYLNTLSEQAALRYYDLLIEKIGACHRCRSDARSRVILRWLPRATGI